MDYDDFDYFPDGVSCPDYVITGCDPAEYAEDEEDRYDD